MNYTEELFRLVEVFMKKSKETDRTTEQTYDQLKKHNLWVLRNKNRLLGYVVVELINTEYRQVIAVIHQLYLEGKAMTKCIRNRIDSTIQIWSKKMGAEKMVFCTKRNSDAFERLLKNGWNVDSVILSKNVCA